MTDVEQYIKDIWGISYAMKMSNNTTLNWCLGQQRGEGLVLKLYSVCSGLLNVEFVVFIPSKGSRLMLRSYRDLATRQRAMGRVQAQKGVSNQTLDLYF